MIAEIQQYLIRNALGDEEGNECWVVCGPQAKIQGWGWPLHLRLVCLFSKIWYAGNFFMIHARNQDSQHGFLSVYSNHDSERW